MSEEKTVGVIGGLGPEATLDFFSKLLQATDAKTDQDHLHVIINNNPKVPNRHASIAGSGPSAVPALLHSAKALERAGVDFLVMACNTAHAYEAEICEAVPLPFISIIEVTVQACLKQHPQLDRVGLLAADGCLATELYQQRFEAAAVSCLCPLAAEQAQLMEAIFAIKANQIDDALVRRVHKIADALLQRDAQLIVAACTEVPLVLDREVLSFISSTDALVEATIAFARA